MNFKEYMDQEIATSTDKIIAYQSQIEALEGYGASLLQGDAPVRQKLQEFIVRRVENISRLKEIAQARKREEVEIMGLIEKMGQK